MPISIPSSVDGELTNYQLQITIVKGSGSNSGSVIYLDDDAKNWPDDIRFTSSDGTTLIDFWREESDATDGTWWVEVPTVPASGGTTIYIYYGKSDASDVSDPAATFDNFIPTTTTDGWTGGTNILSIVNDDELRYYDSDNKNYVVYKTLNDDRVDFICEVAYYCENPGAESWVAVAIQDADTGDRWTDSGSTSNATYRQFYRVGATLTNLYNSFAWSTVYRWKINVRRSATKLDYYLYDEDGSLLASTTDKGPGWPAGGSPDKANQLIIGAGSAVRSDTRFKLIRTRAYTANPPSPSAGSPVLRSGGGAIMF